MISHLVGGQKMEAFLSGIFCRRRVVHLYLKSKLKILLLHLFLSDSTYWNTFSGGHNEMHHIYFNEEMIRALKTNIFF